MGRALPDILSGRRMPACRHAARTCSSFWDSIAVSSRSRNETHVRAPTCAGIRPT